MYEELTEIIKGSDNIVFFGGAGVSTESNIPDFRSEAGLYSAQSNYGMSPEQMLSHSFFVRDTETFFDYYKNNLIYTDAEPNDAHKALAKLEEMGKLKAVVTQNIDGLHQKAGFSETIACTAEPTMTWTILWIRSIATDSFQSAKSAAAL